MIRFPIPGRAKREALSTLVLPLLLSLSLAPAAFAQQQSPAKPGAKPAPGKPAEGKAPGDKAAAKKPPREKSTGRRKLGQCCRRVIRIVTEIEPMESAA